MSNKTNRRSRFAPCVAFIRGIARILAPFDGSARDLYDPSLDPRYVDYLALRSDWEAVGRDLAEAISAFSQRDD